MIRIWPARLFVTVHTGRIRNLQLDLEATRTWTRDSNFINPLSPAWEPEQLGESHQLPDSYKVMQHGLPVEQIVWNLPLRNSNLSTLMQHWKEPVTGQWYCKMYKLLPPPINQFSIDWAGHAVNPEIPCCFHSYINLSKCGLSYLLYKCLLMFRWRCPGYC